jgi:glycine cleavage system regulatory protein
MRDMLVLTVSGPDRPGLVEALAAKLAGVGANWEESRMARLAGQFAGILLVTVERARTDELVAALRGKDIGGLHISVHSTRAAEDSRGTRLRLRITAQDRPGIIRDVSRVLREHGANIEELETGVESAPMSGERMFHATLELRVTSTATVAGVRTALESLASELMVDLAET